MIMMMMFVGYICNVSKFYLIKEDGSYAFSFTRSCLCFRTSKIVKCVLHI